MDWIKRHSLDIMTGLVLLCIVAYVVDTAARGRSIRENEKAARDIMESVFQRQEKRLIAELKPPYSYLEDLLEESPSLGDSGVKLQRVATSPPGLTLFRGSGYLFALGLQDEQNEWHHARNTGIEKECPAGQRFRAFAWPQKYGVTGTVVYFVDSRGYLFQGENDMGLFEGEQNIPLIDLDPYQDLEGEGSIAKAQSKNLDSAQSGSEYQSLPMSFRRKWSFIWRLRLPE